MSTSNYTSSQFAVLALLFSLSFALCLSRCLSNWPVARAGDFASVSKYIHSLHQVLCLVFEINWSCRLNTNDGYDATLNTVLCQKSKPIPSGALSLLLLLCDSNLHMPAILLIFIRPWRCPSPALYASDSMPAAACYLQEWYISSALIVEPTKPPAAVFFFGAWVGCLVVVVLVVGWEFP